MSPPTPSVRVPRYAASLDFNALWQEFPPAPDYFEGPYQRSRDQLNAIQNDRFLQQMQRAWQVPFYKKHWGAAGMQPGDVRSLEDLRRIPPFSVHDLRARPSQWRAVQAAHWHRGGPRPLPRGVTGDHRSDDGANRFLDLAVLQQLQQGQLRALAVAGDTRAPELPDVPTVKETGFGEFDVSTAYAYFAPAGTPKPVIDKLYAHIKDALDAPDVQDRLRKTGVQPRIGRPEEVTEILTAKIAQWRTVIREAGIQIER